ncbi:MAG: hypothetical protein GF330_02090 [Candidatus Eisenbacteria bacterium]|nr:hypothetical protein [Candidatus Eisenbacteria bacterium]
MPRRMRRACGAALHLRYPHLRRASPQPRGGYEMRGRAFPRARLILLAAGCLAVLAPSSPARSPGDSALPLERQPAPAAGLHEGNLPQAADTVWFGGDDGHGIALEGGIWDWDTDLPPGDPLHGWTSIDRTVFPGTWFRRITHADSSLHGDPCDPVFDDTIGLIWCGLHEDEATEHEFETGIGYGNQFCQQAVSPAFPIDPLTEALEIGFRYFNDTELDYDFTHALVLGYDEVGEEVAAHEAGELTGIIGSPHAPELFHVVLPSGSLDPSVATARVAFRMTSDGGWSDEDGWWDSGCGAFAADDVEIRVGESYEARYEFDTGADGWSFEGCDGIGAFMASLPEDTWWPWLHDSGIYECGMSGNAVSFVDREDSPWWPPGHPEGHEEMAVSNIVPRAAIAAEELLGAPIRFDTFGTPCDPYANCIVYRLGYTYYPYTSDIYTEPHWSPRLGGDVWWFFGEAGCLWTGGDLMHLSGGGTPLPADWESLRVVYEVHCGTMEQQGCDSRGAPMIDNLRVGFAFEDPSAVDGDSPASAPGTPRLEAARLDPRDGTVRLPFVLPSPARVTVEIFDARGRLVRSVWRGEKAGGSHTLVWDGRDTEGRRVPRGIYRVRLAAGEGFEQARPVVLLR